MGVSSETKLQAILDSTGSGSWEFNIDSEELTIDERLAQMLGYKLSELESNSLRWWETMSQSADLENARAKVADVISQKAKAFDCVVRVRHKDNSWRSIHSRGKLLESKDGRWLFGIGQDFTQQEQERHSHQMAKLAESIPGVVYTFVVEPDGNFGLPFISAKAQELFGVNAEAAMDNPELTFVGIHPDDEDRVMESFNHSFETVCPWSCDYRIWIQDQYSWLRALSLPERGSDRSITWHGMLTDIDAPE